MPRSRPPRSCCTPPGRICPAWPSSATGPAPCSTPNWRADSSASRGSASRRSWRRHSACGWPKATERRTGPPGRCRPNGSGTRHWTSRFSSSSATPWPRCWTSRGRPNGPGRSSRRCSQPSRRGRARRGLAVVRELWQERDAIARRRDISPGRVLPDSAIIEAARVIPASGEELTAIPGFTGRGARRHVRNWMAAVNRARAKPEPALPAPSGPAADGPPPTHRWAERDPAAARRLTAVRAAVAALGESRNIPSENLLHPDAVRRLAWGPPEPPSPNAVAGELAGYGARPWQVELTAAPIASALASLDEQDEREPAQEQD